MITQIETNNYCNHRCWYCQNAHYKIPRPKVMGLELFEYVLKEISKTYAREDLNIISFAAYNEPTLDPHFKQRLRMLTGLGYRYWFISNGSHLTVDLIDFMIQEQISILSFLFNVPAIEPAAFKEAAQVSAENIFPIRDNIIHLLKNWKNPSTEITVVVHGDQGEKHQCNFERMCRFFEPFDVNIAFGPVMNRAGMLNDVVNQAVDHHTDNLACAADYFNNIYVGVEGNLYLCCHDYYQKHSFGNLKDTPLNVLMASEKRYVTINNFKKEFCRYCPFAYPNSIR